MIRIVPEEGVKERFGRRFLLPPRRLDRNKYRVNLRQLLGIVKAHHPSRLVRCPCIEFPGSRAALALLAPSPSGPIPEGVGIHDAMLAVEIERIKDERFALRVKHPAEWFFRAAALSTSKTSAI